MGGRHHYLAKELVNLGHNVTVVAARWHHLLREGVDVDALPAEEVVEGYRFVRIDVPRYSDAHDKRRVLAWFAFAARLFGLRRRLADTPDTILYSSPHPIGYLGAERLAKVLGARLVFEVRDIWPLTLMEIGGYSKRHPFIRFLQWVEDRAYAKADRVVSNLEGAVEHMVSRGMDREKFAWVSNGISLQAIDFPEPLSQEIDRQIPKDGLRIVYTGTLGVANALDTLIAAAEILRNVPGINFILVGQGRNREALQRQCDRLKLDNVHFLGPVPKKQVQSVLGACDVCYIGLTADPLFRFGVSPNKLFDYFISGKPVLYAIESGNFSPVERYQAGLQIPPEDPRALSEAILRVHAMPEYERRAMGENGRRAATEYYDYAKLAQRLEAVLLNDRG